jgi:hypothetical protein
MRYGSTRKASFPADRQRHYRQRQSAGKIIVHIEIDEVPTVDALVSAGFLRADDCDNKPAIAAAIQRVIEALVAGDA